MFREMRRKDRALSKEDAIAFLEEQSYGVLSVQGDDGYPYGVPVNYAYEDGHIYLHGFLSGHKIDAITANPKVCFTVFGNTENLPEAISTNYTSVVAFGIAEVLSMEEEDARQAAFEMITFKFSPENENSISYIEKAKGSANVIKITIKHMTGKRRK